VILYCDSSSLVKLYLEESGSAEVRALVEQAAAVTSSAIADVEVQAALASQRRAGRISPRALAQALKDFDADWSSVLAIDLDDDSRRLAGELAGRYQLRALDAIHLAAFVQVLERRTDDDVQFSSFDDRLNRAARRLR